MLRIALPRIALAAGAGLLLIAAPARAGTLTITWAIAFPGSSSYAGSLSASFHSNSVGNGGLKDGPATLLSWSISGGASNPLSSQHQQFQLLAPVAGTLAGNQFQQTGAGTLTGSWLVCDFVGCVGNLSAVYTLRSFVANLGKSTVMGTISYGPAVSGFVGSETSRSFVPEPGAAGLLAGAGLAWLVALATRRRRP